MKRPKLQTLVRTQQIPQPIESVFSFFQSPENLATITPPWLGFRILTRLPVKMQRGTVIDYSIRWLSFPVRWTTLITEFEPPFLFVDEQTRGPYSLWQHTHTFVGKGGVTEMTDTVRYALPLGVVGSLAHRLIVRRQLDAIFSYRAQVIAELFAAELTAESTIMQEMK